MVRVGSSATSNSFLLDFTNCGTKVKKHLQARRVFLLLIFIGSMPHFPKIL